jgi:16S rRNA (guanine966-N2)-methyltransferase
MADVLQWDIMKGLKPGRPMGNDLYDLVFVDPPYGKNLIPSTLTGLNDKNILAESFSIVVESSRDEDLPSAIENLELFDTRIYGTTKINLYRNRKNR